MNKALVAEHDLTELVYTIGLTEKEEILEMRIKN